MDGERKTGTHNSVHTTLRLLEDEMKVILDEPISREAIRRTFKKQA